MQPVEIVKRVVEGLVARRFRRRTLSCKDCPRSERCGLPPNEGCIVLLTQMALGNIKPDPHRVVCF